MIEWITVSALIIAGLALVVAEVLFVPGTTIVGIFGLLATAFGVYLGFVYFGVTVGWWLTGGSLILLVVALYFSFKSDAWDNFSLKSTISGKVNEGLTSRLKLGDVGRALSTLKPVGKAEFEEGEYEVKSMGIYVDSGTKIRIIKINSNNIFVESIN